MQLGQRSDGILRSPRLGQGVELTGMVMQTLVQGVHQHENGVRPVALRTLPVEPTVKATFAQLRCSQRRATATHKSLYLRTPSTVLNGNIQQRNVLPMNTLHTLPSLYRRPLLHLR